MKNTFEIIYFFLNLCKKESVPNYLKKKPFTNNCGMFAKEKSTTLYVKKNLCVIGQKRTLFKLLYQKQNPTKKITMCV